MNCKIAIIDLGSNSVRMNIYVSNELGGFSVYDQAKEMVRLSEGMDEDGFLKPEPIERTMRALDYFKMLIEVNQVTEVFALSTAAVRMAKNQKYFLEKVKNTLGFDFTVLTGVEEAYYDYLGVVNTIDFNDAVLVDIGGGSTEIVYVKNRKIKESVSLPYGSVILTEHFKHHKSVKKQIEEADAFFKKELDKLKWLKQAKGLPIIGLGGIIRSVGKVSKYEKDIPIQDLHNFQLDKETLEGIIVKIQSTDPSEMDDIKGINKRRADIMSLGITPLKAIAKLIGAPTLSISAYGLRDGYFFEYLMHNRNQSVVVEDVLSFGVDNMMKRFYVNYQHAKHVEHLALELFDGLKSVHNFKAEDRKLLSVAACLHDIGMHIEYYDHHIHGMYLIMNSKIYGLSNLEQLSVAYLVGHHRQDSIKDRFKRYEPFVEKDFFDKMSRLSVLLQIAEQLDRAENGNVKDLRVELSGDQVYLKLEAKQFPELDMASAMKYSSRFEKYYDKVLNLYV